MQLDYLQKILGHIRKGLTCPRCQQAFGSPEIKILAIRDKNIDLAVACPHCGTDARISAEVTTQKKLARRRQGAKAAKISTKAHVSAENVDELRQSISQLSASDIEHLSTEKD